MHTYDTLNQALTDLNARGYKEDFNLKPFCLECPTLNLQLKPEDFEIKEVYRFEGMSNPDDSSVLYGIESNDGIKGVLVDAYGVYSDSVTPEMAKKLRMV